MGCSSSNSSPMGESSVQKLETSTDAKNTKHNVSYPPSEAYVISFNDVENSKNNGNAAATAAAAIVTTTTWNAANSTETFHPPERLQKALEVQSHANRNHNDNFPATSIETITERLEKAEQRRQAIMQQKIEKAQKLMRNLDETIREKENEDDSDAKDVKLEGNL